MVHGEALGAGPAGQRRAQHLAGRLVRNPAPGCLRPLQPRAGLRARQQRHRIDPRTKLSFGFDDERVPARPRGDIARGAKGCEQEPLEPVRTRAVRTRGRLLRSCRQKCRIGASSIRGPAGRLGQSGVELEPKSRFEGKQDGHHGFRGRLQQVHERKLGFDSIHRVDDQLGACVGRPRTELAAQQPVSSLAPQGFIIGSIPGIDVVAVNTEDPRSAHAGQEARPVQSQPNPASGCIVPPAEQREQTIAGPRQREFQIVVAQSDNQPAPLGADQTLQRFPDRGECSIRDDPFQLCHGAPAIEIRRPGFGQKIDGIAVQAHRDAFLRSGGSHVLEPPPEPFPFVEDLPRVRTAHVQIGHDVQLVESIQGKHVPSPRQCRQFRFRPELEGTPSCVAPMLAVRNRQTAGRQTPLTMLRTRGAGKPCRRVEEQRPREARVASLVEQGRKICGKRIRTRRSAAGYLVCSWNARRTWGAARSLATLESTACWRTRRECHVRIRLGRSRRDQPPT